MLYKRGLITIIVIVFLLTLFTGCSENKSTGGGYAEGVTYLPRPTDTPDVIPVQVTDSVYGDNCADPLNLKYAKPVIYLYPEKEQRVSVKLDYKGKLVCTYPDYKDGWNVIAKPDGTITDLSDKREYSYLFWEGMTNKYSPHFDSGFVVKGEDTKEFLQDKLSKIGLTPREYNEFIVHWLPFMKDNKYNLIRFEGADYENIAKLSIEPKPDSVLRVFMVYKSIDKPIIIKEQNIKPFKREGFAVVEWGGAEIKE